MPCESCGSPAVAFGRCQPCVQWQEEEFERQRLSGVCIHRFFEGRQFLGESHRDAGGTVVSGIRYSSVIIHTAYFCPHCGEIWARQIIEPQFTYEPAMANIPPWSVETRRCAKHGDGFLLSALGDHVQMLRACSPSLLQREAYLLCLHQR